MTPRTINSEAIRRAFPKMPVTVLELIEHGDLQRELPDWIDRFVAAHGALSSALHWESRVQTAWHEVLHAYDEKVNAFEAQAVGTE